MHDGTQKPGRPQGPDDLFDPDRALERAQAGRAAADAHEEEDRREALALGDHRGADGASSAEADDADLVPPGPDAIAADPSDARFETVDDPRIPADKSYFKIGEVARVTGLKPYVLRYWETEFPWIRPSKTSARQRLYRRQDIAVLLQIKRLRYEERRTIADTKNLIREHRGTERRSSKSPRRSASPRAPRPSAPAAAFSTGLAMIDLAPMLVDMRRAVLDLLEAVED